LPLHEAARNLEDDAAVLQVGGETLVVTHDAMAEGTHFRVGADLADVAWKLVASNLSDLAAKGARPVGLLLSYMLGDADARFLEGLHRVSTALDVPILGGDTIAASGPRTFAATLIGRATHVPVPSRAGAQTSDAIWLCGRLGDAMLGFEDPDSDHAAAFLRPIPLLDEGELVAPLATAMMDVSDGLLLDASRMAAASNVGFALETGAMPIADRARIHECLSWGDDYALLFTLPADTVPPVAAHRIGSVGP